MPTQGRTESLSTCIAHSLDRLLNRAACRHDVVDHGHAFAGSKSEPAAELATDAVRAALRIDSPSAELPRNLVREDDPAGGRPGHGVGTEQPHPGRDRGPPPL